MYCKNCGKEIDDRAEICIGCGIRAREPLAEKKNPAIAALLSFMVVGAGQVYNGEVEKGIIFFFIHVLFVLLIFVLIGIILTPLFWIYVIYDAYKTAEKINSKT